MYGELRSRMSYADLRAFGQDRCLTAVPNLFTVGLVVSYVEWKLGQARLQNTRSPLLYW